MGQAEVVFEYDGYLAHSPPVITTIDVPSTGCNQEDGLWVCHPLHSEREGRTPEAPHLLRPHGGQHLVYRHGGVMEKMRFIGHSPERIIGYCYTGILLHTIESKPDQVFKRKCLTYQSNDHYLPGLGHPRIIMSIDRVLTTMYHFSSHGSDIVLWAPEMPTSLYQIETPDRIYHSDELSPANDDYAEHVVSFGATVIKEEVLAVVPNSYGCCYLLRPGKVFVVTAYLEKTDDGHSDVIYPEMSSYHATTSNSTRVSVSTNLWDFAKDPLHWGLRFVMHYLDELLLCVQAYKFVFDPTNGMTIMTILVVSFVRFELGFRIGDVIMSLLPDQFVSTPTLLHEVASSLESVSAKFIRTVTGWF